MQNDQFLYLIDISSYLFLFSTIILFDNLKVLWLRLSLLRIFPAKGCIYRKYFIVIEFVYYVETEKLSTFLN